MTETPRDISFCGHAILGNDIFMVSDTLSDERFFDNPLVINDPSMRFYAGCPLSVPNGSKLGTLCLIDIIPRELAEEDRQLLRDLASMVEEEIAAVQLATMDELTLLSNRRGFETLGQHALSVCKRLGKPASLLFFDLNNFKKINDTYGHAEGDRALSTFASALRDVFRESDVVARMGGDEFIVLLTNSDYVETSSSIDRLMQKLNDINQQAQCGYDICFSVGQVQYHPEQHASITALLSEADAKMYAHKQASKQVTKIQPKD